MAYPPPPGHVSLPPKPPPSSVASAPRPNNGFKPAFTAFAPRTVAASGGTRNAGATYSAAPTTNYAAQPSPSVPTQSSYQVQPAYDQNYASSNTPQIKNPFVQTGNDSTSGALNYDPEYEAQIQQWQSAYTQKDDKPGYNKNAIPLVKTESAAVGKESSKTVQRTGGGTSWTDDSLLEWDPAHFRIFVGNLAGEVTDDSLLKAFIKYTSVQKARVIRDKRTTKSKGYGFVSFSNGDDYFQAARDMQGKYIGSHPVLIKRAMTEVRPTTVKNDKHSKHKNRNKGAGGHNKVENGGIEKKQPKTRNGLKVLG